MSLALWPSQTLAWCQLLWVIVHHGAPAFGVAVHIDAGCEVRIVASKFFFHEACNLHQVALKSPQN
jgi:hypothetical protein